MAKKKYTLSRGAGGGSYLKGNINESLALSNLASGALVADTWDEVVNEKTLVSSIVVTWSVDELVLAQGPLEFGVAHSDYTDAEILEVLAVTGSWDSGDKISQERAKRLVRKIGVMVSVGDAGISDVTVNDGKPIKTKLNWMLASGDTLRMWVLNKGAILTTGAFLIAEGHANLWQR